MYLDRANLILFVSIFILSCSSQETQPETLIPIDFELFKKVNPQQSGLTFTNALEENFDNGFNRFQYDYFYNGAGVGVADLNNDGLPDLFFTGNQVENKLFLNQGNLTFKDISKTAGINQNKGWSNGVTFVDINKDGWMDIYVSQGGPLGSDRSNRLYVNQQNLTFKEQSSRYGLNYQGISTQSVFFDYDQDGDLDCLIINEHPLYGYTAREFQYYLKKEPNLLALSSCHLFERAGDTYKNATEKAGLLKPAFGLGVVVSDLNDDGWLDFYLSNDYYIPDALYINQGNGTFKDEVKERTGHVAFAGMGIDIADVNNDGHYDIFNLDMASPDHIRSKVLMQSMNVNLFHYLVNDLDYQHAYSYNTLQLGLGNGTFQNIAHQSGVAKTDWSWAGLLADLDNDEDKDILVTNGTHFTLDNDFHAEVQKVYEKYPAPSPIPKEELIKLHKQIPDQKLPNILFENKGNRAFGDVASNWGLTDSTFSNGAAYADLDLDGDLDLIVSNNNQPASIFQNLTIDKTNRGYLRVATHGTLSEAFPKVRITYEETLQEIQVARVRGYLSSVETTAHFGLGLTQNIDTVRVTWLSGRYEERYNVKANQTLTFNEEDARKFPKKAKKPKSLFADGSAIPFSHKENDYDDFKAETLLPYKQSTQGPFLAKGDVNGDGREDLFIGGAKGQAGEIYLQTAQGYQKVNCPALEKDAMSEDMEAIILDIDGDQDNDLFVVSGGNEYPKGSPYYGDRLYLNDGTGTFAKASNTFIDHHNYSGRSVTALDIENDGDIDLIVANRMVPGAYPLSEPSVVYENNGGHLVEKTAAVAPTLADFGAINKIIASDFDQDGWMDFVAVGEWTGIGLFQNKQGVFQNIADTSDLGNLKGWWFTVTATDINRDSLPDYILGNLGLNSKYKTSTDKPLKIYAGDLDQNGTHDMMLSYQYKQNYVPLRGRECSSGQMPSLLDKYPTYEGFANATIQDIINVAPDEVYQREVTDFRSLLLKNKGNGKFEMVSLPVEAQAFPVLTCVPLDLNNDEKEDLIIAGGIYNTEVETPRLDAGVGLVLLSNGETYETMPPSVSGLYIKGDVKSMIHARREIRNEDLLVVARNNQPLDVLKINSKDEK